MGRFPRALKTVDHNAIDASGRALATLCEPFVYVLDDASDIAIRVPAGFTTDYASVPRMFWRLFLPTGEYRFAAVIHDYLYSRQAKMPKVVADAIFYDAMRSLGVSVWRRIIVYGAVVLFGRAAYHSR